MNDRVDEFESIFKRADKARFHYLRPEIRKVLLVTDLDRSRSEALLHKTTQFLAVVADDQPDWTILCYKDYDRRATLLEKVSQHAPDLIVTYRNLQQVDKDTPSSLGVIVDALTQTTAFPVILLPDEPHRSDGDALLNTDTVMVITDHMVGDDRLVNFGVRITRKGGRLHLCHIEDDKTFRYYMAAIEKIPTIETERAGQSLREQLLKQPADYIHSCMEVLREHRITAQLESHVQMGHTVHDYRRLVEACSADLLVLNTKDQDQLAMHALAYPIAVEFRHVPLLML